MSGSPHGWRDGLCLAVRSGTLHDEIERLRRSLGEPDVSPMERLLIDQVVICYLRMNLTEQYYENAMTDGCSLAARSYWERKLSTVQRRYLRSIETLARVRKLMRQIAMRIAVVIGLLGFVGPSTV